MLEEKEIHVFGQKGYIGKLICCVSSSKREWSKYKNKKIKPERSKASANVVKATIV